MTTNASPRQEENLNFKTGTIWNLDNLDLMRGMNSETVDLIALDPPFKKQKPFKSKMNSQTVDRLFEYIDLCRDGRDIDFARTAEEYIMQLMNDKNEIWMQFDDAWYLNQVKKEQLVVLEQNYPDIYKFINSITEDDMKAYMIFMAVRILEMHRVLRKSGSLYLHCDQAANSYLRILLDIVFGSNNLRNQIIWSYASGGASKRQFAKKHDTILYYTKDKDYVFNLQKEKSYNRDYKPYRFKGVEEFQDQIGWYTLVNARDVWHINMVGRTSKERLGYPTQKPLALLQRIVAASTNEGDIVFDPFAGCATAIDAAYSLNRRWIACDISYMSVILLRLRLEGPGTLLNNYIYKRTEIEPPTRDDDVGENFEFEKSISLSHGKKDKLKQKLFGKQKGKCVGCGKPYLYVNFQMDHITPLALGSPDNPDNFQLLCGPCNRKKRDRPESECKDWMYKYTGKVYYH